MAVLDVLEFPDPRLRTVAKPVEQVDDELRALIDDMFDTMYQAPGIGLAATQVNVHKRVLVVDVSEERNEPRVFINPEVTPLTDETGELEEGCLSVPGFNEAVERPNRVHVRARDYNGEFVDMEAEGLLAVCLQHELDHLEGRLFVDHISRLKRQRIRKKLEKQQKQHA